MALFGLGAAEVATQVQVTWPDGRVRTLRNVSANQRLSVLPEAVAGSATYRVVPVMSPAACVVLLLLLMMLAHQWMGRQDER